MCHSEAEDCDNRPRFPAGRAARRLPVVASAVTRRTVGCRAKVADWSLSSRLHHDLSEPLLRAHGSLLSGVGPWAMLPVGCRRRGSAYFHATRPPAGGQVINRSPAGL